MLRNFSGPMTPLYSFEVLRLFHKASSLLILKQSIQRRVINSCVSTWSRLRLRCFDNFIRSPFVLFFVHIQSFR
uniref:Uncharacterized protein n=1 Tax=Salmonella sp. TaxID=599 RepID=A0A482EX02_SALSP|nr:hypothetical protein NNIBIDOC_00032 [Salmonella sp.]